MSRPPARRLGTLVRLAGLPIVWGVFALLMARDYAGDTYDPAVHGPRSYGHNHEGALRDFLVWTLAELAVVYLILRPWSYRRSWKRAMVALLLCLPWTAFSAILLIHAGGVIRLHFFWMCSLVVVLVGCCLVAGAADG